MIDISPIGTNSFLPSNLATVLAPDSLVFLPNVSLDFCFRVDQFLQEGCEGAEVEVADYRVGRVGYNHGYFRRTAHGVAEFAAARKGPCVFADGEEENLECRATGQELHQFLEDAGDSDFEKVSGCAFSGFFQDAGSSFIAKFFLQRGNHRMKF